MAQTTTNIHPSSGCDSSPPSLVTLHYPIANYFVQLLISTIFQDGWRRLEHEKVVASAPDEKSGAGVVGGEEGGTL